MKREAIKLSGIGILGVGLIVFVVCGQELVSEDMLGLTLIMGIMSVAYGFLGVIFAVRGKARG